MKLKVDLLNIYFGCYFHHFWSSYDLTAKVSVHFYYHSASPFALSPPPPHFRLFLSSSFSRCSASIWSESGVISLGFSLAFRFLSIPTPSPFAMISRTRDPWHQSIFLQMKHIRTTSSFFFSFAYSSKVVWLPFPPISLSLSSALFSSEVIALSSITETWARMLHHGVTEGTGKRKVWWSSDRWWSLCCCDTHYIVPINSERALPWHWMGVKITSTFISPRSCLLLIKGWFISLLLPPLHQWSNVNECDVCLMFASFFPFTRPATGPESGRFRPHGFVGESSLIFDPMSRSL